LIQQKKKLKIILIRSLNIKSETFKRDDIDWRTDEGFIYLVKELKTGRYYVGKKNVYSKRTPKGMKNKKRVESNWRTYTTSSVVLSKKIKKAPENYSFYILSVCGNKSSLSYDEMKYMMKYDALINELSYNENGRINLMCKIKNYKSRK